MRRMRPADVPGTTAGKRSVLQLIAEAVGLFLAGALLAVVWAGYTLMVARKRALAASFWSLGIYGIGCFSVISYTAHHWQAIPLAIGDFLGTYVSLRYFPDGEEKTIPPDTSSA